MNSDQDLLRPLWQYPWRWVTFAGLTERLTYLSAPERAARRASWPQWRRAVRPVALALFWASSIFFIAFGNAAWAATVVKVVYCAGLLPLALLGLVTWFKDSQAT